MLPVTGGKKQGRW